MKVGRPTKYNDEMVSLAEGYIEDCIKKGMAPNVAGMCNVLGIHKDTAYEWGKKYPEFSDTLGRLQRVQEQMLLHKGLTGKWNPTIVKLMLANHGYHEKTQTDITSGGEKITKVTVEIVNGTQDKGDSSTSGDN